MHPLHSLTPLTGREAAEKRTVVVGTVELNWRLFMVLASAAPVALLVAAITWPFLGQYAIFVFPIILAGASFLFYRRSNNGMGLHTYQALLDKKRSSDVGKVYLCGYEVDVSATNLLFVRHNTAPYRVDATQVAPVVTSQPTVTQARRFGRRGPSDGHAWNGGFETPGQTLTAPVRGGETRSLASVGARAGASDALASMKGAGERVTGALRPRRRVIADPGSYEVTPVVEPVIETQPVFVPQPVVEPEPVFAPSVAAEPTPVFAPTVPEPAAVPAPVAPRSEPVPVQHVAPPAPVAPVVRPEPVYVPPTYETAPPVVERAPVAAPAPAPAPAPVAQPAPEVAPPAYIASRPEVDAPRQAPYVPSAPAPVAAPAPAPAPVVVPEPEPEPIGFEVSDASGDPSTDFDAGVFFDQPTSRRKRGLR